MPNSSASSMRGRAGVDPQRLGAHGHVLVGHQLVEGLAACSAAPPAGRRPRTCPCPGWRRPSPRRSATARARRTVTRLTPNSSRSSRSVGSCSPGASSPRAIRPSSSSRTRAVSWPRPRVEVVTGERVLAKTRVVSIVSWRSTCIIRGPTISAGSGAADREDEKLMRRRLLITAAAAATALLATACTTPGQERTEVDTSKPVETDITGLPDTTLSVWTSEGGNRLEILKKLAKELRGGEPQRQDQVDGARLRHLPRADQARPELRGRPGRRHRQPRLVARRPPHQGRPVPPARRLRQGLRLGHPLPRGRPAPAQVLRGRHRVRRGADLGNAVRLRRDRLVLQQGPARRPRHGAPDDLRRARGGARRVEGRRPAADRVRQQGCAGPHGTCSTTWSTSTPRSTTSAASSTATRARPTRATRSRKPPRRWSSGRRPATSATTSTRSRRPTPAPGSSRATVSSSRPARGRPRRCPTTSASS